jgi:site-specific DNA-methyltransferase (adenine-specific)
MEITDKITITNEDNMELMSRYPDKHFDLAIVDPPYGIGAGSKKFINRNTKNLKAEKFYRDNDWDVKPNKKYFDELKRVSKNYIVWGGNYFIDNLEPSRCYIVWDKKTGDNSYADCEIALTNIDANARIYTKFWLGAHANNGTPRIHPTEKPVALYKWLLDKYAKIKCDQKHEEHYRYLCTDCNNGNVKILDTHLGSGSIAIACHDYGFDLTACELDLEYYNKAMQRIQNHISQTKLF